VTALTDILELSTFLEWDNARSFAIQTLSSSTIGLTPAHKLSLAISYRIHPWIEPTFQLLMNTQTHSFTVEDSAFLGQRIMMLIVTTQATIRNHRLLVAYNPLKLQHHLTACKQPLTTCQCNWESAWWDGLARHYLHLDFPCSPQDILLKLEKTPVMGVTTECRLHVIELIKQQRVFEVEDDLKAEALSKVMALKGTVVVIGVQS
jgi:hypothetical protein